MFGAEAVELIANDRYGRMVSFDAEGVSSIPITEAIGQLKTVSPDSSLALRTARVLGICLGDE